MNVTYISAIKVTKCISMSFSATSKMNIYHFTRHIYIYSEKQLNDIEIPFHFLQSNFNFNALNGSRYLLLNGMFNCIKIYCLIQAKLYYHILFNSSHAAMVKNFNTYKINHTYNKFTNIPTRNFSSPEPKAQCELL